MGITRESYILAVAAVMAAQSASFAGETGTSQAARTAQSTQKVSHQSAMAAPPAGACAESDDLDNNTQMERVVHVTAAGIAGGAALHYVGGAARNAVEFGKVRDIPVYGNVITNIPKGFSGHLPRYGHFTSAIPLIGKAAGAATVPTTLGQVPYLGSAVKSVPLVGPTVAGVPNPIIVGAVAVDSYIIPKCNPCGYNERSEWAATDFNSPPTVRSYVNYLAPMPYTHPPIYAPSTLNTGRTPNTAPMTSLADSSSVSIPN
jgi:hypothetical protein